MILLPVRSPALDNTGREPYAQTEERRKSTKEKTSRRTFDQNFIDGAVNLFTSE